MYFIFITLNHSMYPGVFLSLFFCIYFQYCVMFTFFFFGGGGKRWDLTLYFDRSPIFLDYLYYLLSLKTTLI